ncbi:hypothetical protein JB92DRAFT_1019736 [Gautieria morchelliformis]|nr:hypothetical protein JB92DRAFT_1019736 [Gautieria morchelliformis]
MQGLRFGSWTGLSISLERPHVQVSPWYLSEARPKLRRYDPNRSPLKFNRIPIYRVVADFPHVSLLCRCHLHFPSLTVLLHVSSLRSPRNDDFRLSLSAVSPDSDVSRSCQSDGAHMRADKTILN